MLQKDGNRSEELDDFWDIGKLVPKKSTTLHHFATEPVTTLLDLSSGDEKASSAKEKRDPAERKINFSRHASEEKGKVNDESYVPEWNELIKRVTVKRGADKYDFYGNFRKAALIYYDYKTDKCDYVPFFSYMPQYSQLTAEQKNYYFYWRSEIRRGKFPKTDYSYLYLYVYEILNLPDKIPAEEGICMLCSLWRAYRAELPKIGHNFFVWIQDYCFIHRLPCPTDELGEFMYEVIAASDFKEFYLTGVERLSIESVESMIAFLSDYDWRRGKFIEQSVTDAYRKHMLVAMRSLLLHLASCGELFADGSTEIVTRNAFPNSLCTHSVKCRLEIEYISLAGAESLRTSVTAAVRYTENKIRALLGVKSRLAVKELPDKYKEIIDEYFALLLDRDERIRKKEEIPEYEKLYDAPSEALSFLGADEIERASWETTQRLVSESEDDPVVCNSEENAAYETKTEAEAKHENFSSDVSEKDTCELSEREIAVLRALFSGEDPGVDLLMLESYVERINEVFFDIIGDVVIFYDGEKYTFYDDYTEEIGEWLLKLTK